ncbi:MAG: DeoR/GlpR family DNA-binding transcription regulator [Bacteroidota bacterium]
MLKAERHAYILKALKGQDKVLTMEMSQQLGVSVDTVRRDLNELADLGHIRKVHGGAVSHSLNPLHYHDREVYAWEEKKALAQLALSLLRPGQVILMDGGTTNLALAQVFPPNLPATVFTNSLPVAVTLADASEVEVVCLGGRLLKHAQVCVGSDVLAALEGLQADICFLGTRSIHAETGISEIEWAEAKVKRAMVDHAAEVAALVIPEKIGTSQPYIVCGPRHITTIVSGLPSHDPRLLPFRAHGVSFM